MGFTHGAKIAAVNTINLKKEKLRNPAITNQKRGMQNGPIIAILNQEEQTTDAMPKQKKGKRPAAKP